MLRQARAARVIALLEGLDEDNSAGARARPVRARIRALAWIPSASLSLGNDELFLQVTQTIPPELAADIMEQGIVLAGGGALLNGLAARLEHETGMPIVIAPNPLYCVAIGSGQSLEEFEALKGVLFSSSTN